MCCIQACYICWYLDRHIWAGSEGPRHEFHWPVQVTCPLHWSADYHWDPGRGYYWSAKTWAIDACTLLSALTALEVVGFKLLTRWEQTWRSPSGCSDGFYVMLRRCMRPSVGSSDWILSFWAAHSGTFGGALASITFELPRGGSRLYMITAWRLYFKYNLQAALQNKSTVIVIVCTPVYTWSIVTVSEAQNLSVLTCSPILLWMCPDCQHERLWNLVLWGVDGGCAHRAHHHHAAVKCAQCTLECKPQFVDITISEPGCSKFRRI